VNTAEYAERLKLMIQCEQVCISIILSLSNCFLSVWNLLVVSKLKINVFLSIY